MDDDLQSPDLGSRERRGVAWRPSRISAANYAVAAIGRRETLLLIAFCVLAVWFNYKSGGVFFSPRNLSLLIRQVAVVGVVASGVLVLIVMAEIDLSIGSAVYLVSVVIAVLQAHHGWSTGAVIVAAIGVGGLLGAWNGFWVTYFGVPSFIVTLGGLLAFRGIGYVITNANTVAPVDNSLVSLSESFLPIPLSYLVIGICLIAAIAITLRRFQRASAIDAGSNTDRAVQLLVTLLVLIAVAAIIAWVVGGYAGIPTAGIVLVGTIGVLTLVMGFTRFGLYSYVVGGNRGAARLAGISVDRQLMRGFILMGILYGVAGVLVTARLGASTPSTGTGLELDAIAAAVLGGAVLLGGSGRVPQALYGAVLLATIDNGMSLLNISSFVQDVVKGAVLLIAVASDTWARKRRERQ